METAVASKSEPRKAATHSATDPIAVPMPPQLDAGATAGMPLFLQRASISGSSLPLLQQQAEEEEVEENTGTLPIQRKCETCAAEAEEQEEKDTSQVQLKPVSEQISPTEEDPDVQFQLTIGQPGDIYERQADAIAEQVVNQPPPSATPQIQAQCTTCGTTPQLQPKFTFPLVPDAEQPSVTEASFPEETTAVPEVAVEAEEADAGKGGSAQVNLPNIQPPSITDEEPPTLQSKAIVAGDSPMAGGSAQQQQSANQSRIALKKNLDTSQGNGQPLAPPVRSHMERQLGRDLSQIRIHIDGTSAQMNQQLRSRAFTHRNDIYFNSGEYQPDSQKGQFLLVHETVHAIQQGAIGDRIQRFVPPEQTAELPSEAERPEDGTEVESRMREKINTDSRVQDRDDLSEEEREEARNPDREEVRQESSEISSSGESRPSVDRGAIAREQTETQQTQIDQQVQDQPPEASEEEAGATEEESRELSDAEAAAQRAQAAEQQAFAVQIPEQPQPFEHPPIEAPVDSAGEPLPRNSEIDTQVRGLGYVGEMLRQKGYEMKLSAAEQEIGSYGQDAVIERQREDLANAETGTDTIEEHNAERQEIAQQSHKVLSESVERQQFVADAAPGLAAQADAGQAESGELAGEARSTADRSEGEIPDDPDARADAEEQSGDMQDAATGAESMDEAIQQTGARARQYQQDAEMAAEQNQASEAQITETEEIITQTDARIDEMHAANAASQSQIEAVESGPALIRSFARRSAESGDELVAASIVMEDELNSLQDEYLSRMAAIESREEAEQRLQEQSEQEPPPELSPEEQELVELAGMSDAEQEQYIAELDQNHRDRLLAALERMAARTPEQGVEEAEGQRIQVDTSEASQSLMRAQGSASEAVFGTVASAFVDDATAEAFGQSATQTLGLGEQAADPRQEQIQEVENRRIERVDGVLNVADQNMNHLTEEQQQMLANRLVAQSITDDIANINVLQMGEDMLKGMINPATAMQGVIQGFGKTLTGLANIGNWEAWQRDPLGNLLQIAADISTGLATVFSSILGIAAIITALMVALTIFSWGFLTPVTGPVIAWMGTVMTYAGWGAIIAGSLAVYFNYLAYIKNLHDAGTAETARELFGNTEQMQQNASDGFQGAMAVVEGVGAVKMGPSLRSGDFFSHVPRSPGQWARQTVQGVREGAAAVAAAPGRFVRGARRLFSGGRQGLLQFKERLQSLFRRRHPGEMDVDLDTPETRARHQSHLDEARSKRVQDMDDAEFRAEMQEAGQNRPRQVGPDSEHFDDYDIEIEANGHTYRRRRDGRGWCRFSAEECGITDSSLPPKIRDEVRDLEPSPRRHTLDEHQQSVLDEIADDMEAYGLDWEDLGLRGADDIDGFLARYDDVYDGIAGLNQRLDRQIDIAGSRASLENRGIPSRRPEPGLRPDQPGWTRRTERLEESGVFGRASEIETRRMLDQSFNNVADQVRIRPILDNGQPADFYFIVDHLGNSRAGGQLIAFESKISPGAPLTPNQSAGYPLLSRNGGIVESRSAGIYRHGMNLPSTQSFRVQPRIDPRTGGFLGAGPRGYKFKPLSD
ncbi:eCIS core domain-containing protein [Pantanalinema rosaneae CENA516]|uniref:eCIS core domain-containing protein n=1 Tax=Pantanalinema rosaneae TaxID=1620701 RepID=UPI003D6E0A13